MMKTRPSRWNTGHGITVVELLVALAVMGIALLTLAGTLGIANRSNRINAERVESSEVRLLITQVLQYHVRLAGYVGADPTARVGTLCGRSVEIPANGDRITVRYVEDRDYGASEPINLVTCSTGDRVSHITFRAENGFLLQNGVPLIDGVEGFDVVAVINTSGAEIEVDGNEGELFPLAGEDLGEIVGVSIAVTLEDDRAINLTIPFVNVQRDFVGTIQTDAPEPEGNEG